MREVPGSTPGRALIFASTTQKKHVLKQICLAGDPELDAQVPAPDLPGAEARGEGGSASHGHSAGALQELRLPGDSVHSCYSLPEPAGMFKKTTLKTNSYLFYKEEEIIVIIAKSIKKGEKLITTSLFRSFYSVFFLLLNILI